MLTITASELKVGDSFKLSSRHRKVITISQIIDLDKPGRKESTPPEIYAEHYENRLLFMNGCGQTDLLKTDNVLLIKQ